MRRSPALRSSWVSGSSSPGSSRVETGEAPRRAKASLRALVVVANPKDVDRWAPGGRQLAPVDVASEVKRARDGLVGITVTTWGRATGQRCTDSSSAWMMVLTSSISSVMVRSSTGSLNSGSKMTKVMWR